jgi:hypothetical protein
MLGSSRHAVTTMKGPKTNLSGTTVGEQVYSKHGDVKEGFLVMVAYVVTARQNVIKTLRISARVLTRPVSNI